MKKVSKATLARLQRLEAAHSDDSEGCGLVVELPRSPDEWERVVPIEQAELKRLTYDDNYMGTPFKAGPVFDIESKEYLEAVRGKCKERHKF